jgi:ferredoxin
LFEFDDTVNVAKALPVEILARQEVDFREAVSLCPGRAIRVAELPVLVEG